MTTGRRWLHGLFALLVMLQGAQRILAAQGLFRSRSARHDAASQFLVAVALLRRTAERPACGASVLHAAVTPAVSAGPQHTCKAGCMRAVVPATSAPRN